MLSRVHCWASASVCAATKPAPALRCAALREHQAADKQVATSWRSLQLCPPCRLPHTTPHPAPLPTRSSAQLNPPPCLPGCHRLLADPAAVCRGARAGAVPGGPAGAGVGGGAGAVPAPRLALGLHGRPVCAHLLLRQHHVPGAGDEGRWGAMRRWAMGAGSWCWGVHGPGAVAAHVKILRLLGGRCSQSGPHAPL